MTTARATAAERLWRLPLLALGGMLTGLSGLMGLTGLFDVVAGEDPSGDFAAALLALFVGVGLLITFRRGSDQPAARMSLRTAFLLTALGWLVLPMFAAIPFALAPEPLSLTDALFETVSGLTTTGSTVISGLDEYPAGLLLWRSLLQWIGGVGLVVMAVVLLPFLRVGGMQLFQVESSDRSGERVVPRSGTLVLLIIAVYFVLSVACAIAYAASGMTAFDAINHAMTTISTGGYSTHDRSLGAYDSNAVRWTAVVFMMAGALPFTAYVRLMRRRIDSVWSDAQLRFFLVFVFAVVAVATLVRATEPGADVVSVASHTATNIVSVITTTGYMSEDYQLWGAGFMGLFFALIFFGGCAGSTTGGIKAYRFQLLFMIARDHMRGLYDPNVIQPRRFAGKVIDEELVQSVLAFIAMYVGAVSVGALLLSFTGQDLVTALSGAAQAMGNVGPGLGDAIGPAGNFAALPDPAKWVLTGLMLLGRLELFAILVLLDPRFWRG